jgi:hypothetical protein
VLYWGAQGRHHVHPGPFWVSWTRRVLANASVSCAQGVHGRAQWSEVSVKDMLMVRGEDRDDEWHGGWHHATAWACSGPIHHGTVVPMLGIVQGVQGEVNDDKWSEGLV